MSFFLYWGWGVLFSIQYQDLMFQLPNHYLFLHLHNFDKAEHIIAPNDLLKTSKVELLIQYLLILLVQILCQFYTKKH